MAAKKNERRFIVTLRLSVFSDRDGFFYINPIPENIERIIRDGLNPYDRTGDLKVYKIQVVESQSLKNKSLSDES